MAPVVGGQGPDTTFHRRGTQHHLGDITQIDRPVVPRADHQQTDVRHAAQGLSHRDASFDAGIANAAAEERAVGALNLGHQLFQGDTEQGQLFRIRLDADLLGTATGDIGQTDIVHLDQLEAQLFRQRRQIVVGPARRRLRLGRQCQRHHGDVVDAAFDDQGLGNSGGDAIKIGANPFMHPQDRVILAGSHQEPRGYHHPVVLGLAVDMLDAADPLDDGFQRPGDQFDRVRRLQPVGIDQDVDHRHADLRLFLAGDGRQGDGPCHEGRQQEQRGQR